MLSVLQMMALIMAAMFVLIGLPMVFCSKELMKMYKDALASKSYMLLAGFLNIVFAVVILSQGYKLTMQWETVVTVIGYIALLKAISIFWFPALVTKSASSMIKSSPCAMSVYGFIMVALGICLGYLVFYVY